MWKHQFLVILQNFFHCGSTQPAGAMLSIHYNDNRRRQLYVSNVMDWPLPPLHKKRPMYWSKRIWSGSFSIREFWPVLTITSYKNNPDELSVSIRFAQFLYAIIREWTFWERGPREEGFSNLWESVWSENNLGHFPLIENPQTWGAWTAGTTGEEECVFFHIKCQFNISALYCTKYVFIT